MNLKLQQFDYFKDHIIQGQILFPATSFIELVIAAINESQSLSHGSGGILIKNVVLARSLILTEEEPTEIHTILLNNSNRQFFIYSRSSEESRDSVRSSGIASNDIIPDYSNSQLLQDYLSNEWLLHALSTVTQSKNHAMLYNVETIQQTFHSFDEEDNKNNRKNNTLYTYLTN